MLCKNHPLGERAGGGGGEDGELGSTSRKVNVLMKKIILPDTKEHNNNEAKNGNTDLHIVISMGSKQSLTRKSTSLRQTL